MLNGLDLFSGIGGLSLALDEWVRPLLHCENDRYAQAVLLSRMYEGELPWTPIWDDVRTLSFPTGMADIIVGGFPCQDISVAGLGAGLAGERSGLFFEIVRLTKEIRPSFVFLENVPAIRTRGLREVVRAFTDLRYDCRWTCVSAAEVGAPHLRKRWFLLAFSDSRRNREKSSYELSQLFKSAGKETGFVAHSSSERRQQISGSSHGDEEKNEGRRAQEMYESECNGEGSGEGNVAHSKCGNVRYVDSGATETIGNEAKSHEGNREQIFNSEYWSTEPNVGGTSDGVSIELDRDRGVDDAEEIEESAREILRNLQGSIGAETLWQETRGLDCISAEETLLAFVRQYETNCGQAWELLASETPSEGCLRALREQSKISGPSLRRGPIEQFFRERSDFMRELSCLVASRGKTPWDSPLWESTVPRVVSGIPNRMDRIKCLGNAVVPLQAKIAFERLMGIEGIESTAAKRGISCDKSEEQKT